MELINKTQDKWIFLGELWKKWKSSQHPASAHRTENLWFLLIILPHIFHSLDGGLRAEGTQKTLVRSETHRTERDFSIYRLNYDIFILRLLFDVKQKGIYGISIAFLCFSAFQFSIHYENVASTTSRSRYDKSNDSEHLRWRRISKKVSVENLANFPISSFPNQKRCAVVVNCEKFEANRLPSVLMARICRTRNDLLCKSASHAISAGSSAVDIGQSDRC